MAQAHLPLKIGPYRLGEPLGQGGMASVVRATDERTNTVVALKLMNPSLSDDATFVARFRREAKISSGLKHRNIVGVSDFGEADGFHFLASELVEGGTLSRLIPRGRRVPAVVATELIGQLLDGLAYAHRAGVVHRDLKPANLLMTRSGVLKIADFGIARTTGDTNLTQTGLITGTPRYMSPEQVLGAPVDSRSDLFTTGIIFFELLSAAAPTGSDSAEVALARLVSKQLTPLLEASPLVPAWVVPIVERLMGFTVEERFQTADEALKLLEPARKRAPATLVRDYLAKAEVLQSELDRLEAETLLTRARASLAQTPPHYEAAALAGHLALQLDPSNAEARRLAAELASQVRLHFEPSENPKVRELEKRLETQPHDSQVLQQLTQLYRAEGNLLRAAQCQRRYVALRPDDAYGRSQLARLAGEGWLPTINQTAPKVRQPLTSTVARKPGPPPVSAQQAPVVVYDTPATTSGNTAWIKWILVAAAVLALGIVTRAVVRSIERSEEARVKAMEDEFKRQGELSRELEIRAMEKFGPRDEVTDAGDPRLQ